jgi:hypothetical protein
MHASFGARKWLRWQIFALLRVFVWLSCLKYLLAAGLFAPAVLRGAKRDTAIGVLIRFQGPEKLRFDDLA